MDKTIVIEFSGWLKINPENIVFQHTGKEKPHIITGEAYILLSDTEKSQYFIDSMGDAIEDCSELDWCDLSVIVEDE